MSPSGQLAMNKQKPRIALRLCVIEVRSDCQRLQRCLGVLSGVDFALAYGLHAASIAKQFIVESS